MPIDKSKLTKVGNVYPLKVSPYEQYMGDFSNPSVVSKINSMIQTLLQMGRLTNQTVSQWNTVMEWIVNGGMDEIATTIAAEKAEVALAEVMRMLDVSLDNGLKDLAENVTDTKIDELLASGQFESMISESLVEINDVVEGKLEGFAGQLAEITTYISSYQRLTGEDSDLPRFKRAIDYLVSVGGGKLLLERVEYTFDDSLIIPNGVEIEGKGNGAAWSTTNVTLLTYTGNETFIKINSYYNRKAGIVNCNIRANGTLADKPNTIAIHVLYNGSAWGGSAVIKSVSITNFAIGIRHSMTWQSSVDNCIIWKCGIGVSYYAKTVNGESNLSTFGNANTVERTTIFECNIGVELASDTLTVFKHTDVEKCYVGIHMYRLTGFLPPQQIRFESCWFESNGIKSYMNNDTAQPKRYLLANSEIDNTFMATGLNSVGTSSIEFINCRDDMNSFPHIPDFNTDYEFYHIRSHRINLPTWTDQKMSDVFEKPTRDLMVRTLTNGGSSRTPYRLSNKGLEIKDNLNGFTRTFDYGETTVYEQKSNFIEIASSMNPDLPAVANEFSQNGIISVFVERHNGEHGHAMFTFARIKKSQNIMVYKIGETLTSGLENITLSRDTGSPTLAIRLVVSGSQLKSGTLKMNYLPNGLLV